MKNKMLSQLNFNNNSGRFELDGWGLSCGSCVNVLLATEDCDAAWCKVYFEHSEEEGGYYLVGHSEREGYYKVNVKIEGLFAKF